MICVGKVLPKILAQSPSWGGVPFREPPFALCQIRARPSGQRRPIWAPLALCQIHDVRYGVFRELVRGLFRGLLKELFRELFKELFRELSRELFSLALALVSSASVECRLLLSSVCMHTSVCMRVYASECMLV